MTSGLAAYGLWEVTDCQIHGVRGLVAKEGDLCLVGRDDDGNDSCARFVSFDSVLL